jgi:hypothetical protein
MRTLFGSTHRSIFRSVFGELQADDWNEGYLLGTLTFQAESDLGYKTERKAIVLWL